MSGELTIDIGALKRNYKALDIVSTPDCETACVVKANAYGLGADKCAPALYEAGARSFFVATSEEGAALRSILPQDADIYVLGGLDFGDKQARAGIIPVLNSLAEIEQARKIGNNLPVALHFDTGMNRLGLGEDEAQALYQEPSILESLDVRLVISHFASSEELDNPGNKSQLSRFDEIIERTKPLFPNARYSIANSCGLFLGADHHFDMVRAGIALYGAHPTLLLQGDNPVEPVVSLQVPVLQIRTALKGTSAGYNSTYRFSEDTTLAVVSAGYADGLPRSLSNNGTLYWKGYALPIRGRVSMDAIICDLANVPKEEHPKRGDMIEVFGSSQTLESLATSAGTISHEIVTSLGARYKRVYKHT